MSVRTGINTATHTSAFATVPGTGAARTVTWNDNNFQIVTLDANTTFTFVDPPGVGSFTLHVKQDGTGSRTVTWPAAVKWPNNQTPPTLTTTANHRDVIVFHFNGTNYFGALAGFDYDT